MTRLTGYKSTCRKHQEPITGHKSHWLRRVAMSRSPERTLQRTILWSVGGSVFLSGRHPLVRSFEGIRTKSFMWGLFNLGCLHVAQFSSTFAAAAWPKVCTIVRPSVTQNETRLLLFALLGPRGGALPMTSGQRSRRSSPMCMLKSPTTGTHWLLQDLRASLRAVARSL
jgi:hypothetical protein